MRVKNMFLSLFAVTIMTFANLGANINCIGIMYQPKFPEKKETKTSNEYNKFWQ